MEVADDWEGEYSLDSEVVFITWRSEEHTSELQSQSNIVCRLLLEKKKNSHVCLLGVLHPHVSFIKQSLSTLFPTRICRQERRPYHVSSIHLTVNVSRLCCAL